MNTRKKNANQYRFERRGPEQDGEHAGQAHQQREVAQERDRQRDRDQPSRGAPAQQRSLPADSPTGPGTGPRWTTWLAK